MFSLAVALLLAAPPQNPSFEIPIIVQERASVEQTGTPLRLGIPFPVGLLPDPAPMEIERVGLGPLWTDNWALSRWPDGSVRWLAVEFYAPALQPGETFDGTLVPIVSGPRGGMPKPGDAIPLGELPLGSIEVVVETTSADHAITRSVEGSFDVERPGAVSSTLVRRDQYFTALGREAYEVTQRLDVFHGTPFLRLQVSLDVKAGVHYIDRWDIVLPLDNPGTVSRAALSLDQEHSFTGDFDLVQLSDNTFWNQGQVYAGRLPGVLVVDDTLIALENFWQLHPSAISRSGSDVVVGVAPALGTERFLVEEGFGRTQTVWIMGGDEVGQTPANEFAKIVESPLVARSTPDWYLSTGAAGPLSKAGADAGATKFEDYLEESTDRVMDRAEDYPTYSYGLAHYGDFFDRESSVAYWGASQQEYDPGLVMLLHYLRSGKESFLDRGMDVAWHYADVDISSFGGAFQHRATSHHVESWIALHVAQEIEAETVQDPLYNGTLASLFLVAQATHGVKYADRMAEHLAAFQRQGVSHTDELMDLAYKIAGQDDVNKVADTMLMPSGSTIRDFAVAIIAHPRLKDYSLPDADTMFAGFFQVYGGDWEEFPSFHVDSHYHLDRRHQGSHSLIEMVVLGYCLTGEPRLREVALAYADYLTSEIVAKEIQELEDKRTQTSDYLRTRRLAWTLQSLNSLRAMTAGIPELADLNGRITGASSDCAQALILVPLDRLESTIHVAVTLEALASYHIQSRDASVVSYLVDLGGYWASNMYDWNAHQFRHRLHGQESYSGMTGLMLYGLAYAQHLQFSPGLQTLLEDAWDNLPQRTDFSKAYAMVYRSSARALWFILQLRN